MRPRVFDSVLKRPVSSQPRFCSTCGGEKANGTCPRCAPSDAMPARRGPGPSGSPRFPAQAPSRRHLISPIASALALVIAAASVAVALHAKDDATHTTTRLATAQSRTVALQKQLSSMATSDSVLNTRLGKLEATVNGSPDPAAIAKKSAPSVFTVITDEDTGSGFVVSADSDSSEVITNFHVIADTYEAGGRTVRIKRGDLTYTGRITRTSQLNDLAVIQVPLKLPVLKISTTRPAIGKPLLVLGSPLGLGGTVTSGIVSAYRTEDGTKYLQFSAPISPGNSGGPVINDQGKVVGVTVAKYTGDGAEGLSLAIPAEKLCPAIEVC